MSTRFIIKTAGLILITLGLLISAAGHPASGIVVDQLGNIYFIYTGHGVIKIAKDGKLTYIHQNTDGHWMCLDERGVFSRAKPKYFERITPDGATPAIIFAGGGSPIVVSGDGNFYYCGGPNRDLNPGALTVVRETPQNEQTFFSPHLEDTLSKLDDGIAGLAAGPDGSLYISCWNSLLKVTLDGKVKILLHPVAVTDCDDDPADHRASNRGKPFLRGLAVDSAGTIYAAATSCHCLLKISPEGEIRTILKADRPWTTTGVAARNGEIYVLEYTNANGPGKEGWYPRVRKIDRRGNVTTIADLSPKRN